MERRPTQPTLMDGYISELGDPKLRAKLARLNAAVPWTRLAAAQGVFSEAPKVSIWN